ncbi:MAG: hypothetical protein GY775_10010 [Candidatus Scalindua sp.]|nr:hypothetical protein [Candidatus Scalindua sp.]
MKFTIMIFLFTLSFTFAAGTVEVTLMRLLPVIQFNFLKLIQLYLQLDLVQNVNEKKYQEEYLTGLL